MLTVRLLIRTQPEKNTLDVFDNPNADVLLEKLKPAGSLPFDGQAEFVVVGVVTEYCVRCTVEGLLRRKRRVSLVTDAIQSLDSATGQRLLGDFQGRGVRLLTTDEALALLNPSLARSA